MASLVGKIRLSVAMLIRRLSHRPSEHAGSSGEGSADLFGDRVEWDRAWSSRPHRRLDTPLRIDVTSGLQLGRVVSVTISEDPPEFSDRVLRPFDECPVCGQTTVGKSRRASSVHPVFENGISNISIGAWVHIDCFESCPDTGEPAPIPW